MAWQRKCIIHIYILVFPGVAALELLVSSNLILGALRLDALPYSLRMSLFEARNHGC